MCPTPAGQCAQNNTMCTDEFCCDSNVKCDAWDVVDGHSLVAGAQGVCGEKLSEDSGPQDVGLVKVRVSSCCAMAVVSCVGVSLLQNNAMVTSLRCLDVILEVFPIFIAVVVLVVIKMLGSVSTMILAKPVQFSSSM
eukprot:6152113-Amphidinium_carterae.1